MFTSATSTAETISATRWCLLSRTGMVVQTWLIRPQADDVRSRLVLNSRRGAGVDTVCADAEGTCRTSPFEADRGTAAHRRRRTTTSSPSSPASSRHGPRRRSTPPSPRIRLPRNCDNADYAAGATASASANLRRPRVKGAAGDLWHDRDDRDVPVGQLRPRFHDHGLQDCRQVRGQAGQHRRAARGQGPHRAGQRPGLANRVGCVADDVVRLPRRPAASRRHGGRGDVHAPATPTTSTTPGTCG